MSQCCSSTPSARPDTPVPQGALRHKWFIRGMDCGSCAAKVEKALNAMTGVHQARVVYSTERLLVDFDEDGSKAAVESKVKELGFRLEQRTTGDDEQPFWKAHATLALLAVLVGIAGVLSLLAPSVGTPAFYFATGIGVLPFIRKAVVQARNGSWFGIETLISIAVIGALLLGETVEASLVLLLFAVGEMLENYAARKARSGVQGLMQLTPETATRITGQQREEGVPADFLCPGDLIEVRPGDRLPVDCILDKQASEFGQFDESALTGESIPVTRGRDEKVMAGSLVVERRVRLTVVSEPGKNAVDRIVQLIEEAEERRAPIARQVDKFSAWYTPLVIAVSALVMVIPPLLSGAAWSVWAYKSLALLLIACPCALVVSIPAAVTSGLAAAARFGALIKGGAALEKLQHIRQLAFDKTGTLTLGKPEVTVIRPMAGTEDSLLELTAAIEQGSSHPLATAIVNAAKARELDIQDADQVTVIPGQGVEGHVSGQFIRVLAPRYVPGQFITRNSLQTDIGQLEQQGNTVVVVLNKDRVLGLIGLADTLRDDAEAAVEELRRLGVGSVMLTGDNRRAAKTIADRLGIEFRAELLPEDKVSAVMELQDNSKGTVAMVGDGINDAPALKSAELGIAMGRGSDVALETADAALTHERLPELARMIGLSRATARIIRQNIALALGINTLFLVTTMLGITGLMGAVLSDVGGTVLVTLNALRLLRYR